jgi:hypothetical protein
MNQLRLCCKSWDKIGYVCYVLVGGFPTMCWYICVLIGGDFVSFWSLIFCGNRILYELQSVMPNLSIMFWAYLVWCKSKPFQRWINWMLRYFVQRLKEIILNLLCNFYLSQIIFSWSISPVKIKSSTYLIKMIVLSLHWR